MTTNHIKRLIKVALNDIKMNTITASAYDLTDKEGWMPINEVQGVLCIKILFLRKYI